MVKYCVVFCCFGLIFGVCLPAESSVITFPSDAYPTLQAAITAANFGDTILVSAGSYTEPLILKDGVNIIGNSQDKSAVAITSNIVGASNASLQNLSIETANPSVNTIEIPQPARGMVVKGCYIHALSTIVVEGSGISLENNVINADMSYFNLSLRHALIFRNNQNTVAYPNSLKNNTISATFDEDISVEGYLIYLSNSGSIKIANNILNAFYSSPAGYEILTSGSPLLVDGACAPEFDYNTYVGDIEQQYLGPGNIAASALPPEPITNNFAALPETSIAKSAGTSDSSTGQINPDIGSTGNAPDYSPNVPPIISTIFPVSGYITTDGKVPFKATIQDNAGLKSFRMICFDHPAEAITGDIYINGVDSGMDYTLKGTSPYVNFPVNGMSMNFEFRPKTAFPASSVYGSYTRHVYWIGVYDISGNWTSKTAMFYIHQLGSGGGPVDGGDGTDKTIPKNILSR